MKRIFNIFRNAQSGQITRPDMREVMQRVDAQIGRAVEKLADR